MTDYEQRTDRFTADEKYGGYTVLDSNGEKIGKVDDLFLDENDQPEYFGVKMGFLGTSSTLIPADIATIDDERGFIEVSQTKDTVKDGPAFDDDQEITPEYEQWVHSYYGLEYTNGAADRGSYGDDEVTVPVVEDEVVVQKKPVVKEEVRVRKDVVEETQVVEEDVRREEVEVEDATRQRKE